MYYVFAENFPSNKQSTGKKTALFASGLYSLFILMYTSQFICPQRLVHIDDLLLKHLLNI